jgi:hypothetical protein
VVVQALLLGANAFFECIFEDVPWQQSGIAARGSVPGEASDVWWSGCSFKALAGGRVIFSIWYETQMQDLMWLVKIVRLPGGSGTVVRRLFFGHGAC